MPDRLTIDPDIRRAQTPPGWFYTDPSSYERLLSAVLARSWRLVADESQVSTPGSVLPVTLGEGSLDEPVILTRDHDDRLHCLANVCTHRGMRLAEHADHARCLTCRYHGRRFDLDGRFRSMPEFDDAENFPRDEDNLRAFPMARWRQFIFASLDPEHDLSDVTREMDARVGFLPIERARLDASRCREYYMHANWALYIDNYLEGFHIPFVHPSLAGALDYGAYETECYPFSNLQVGVASGGEDTFDFPAGHPDHGRDIAGYYFWLFPTTMFNVYPWGISVNDVLPIGPGRTRVRFLPYVWDESRLGRGASADLDRVEREDESVVEGVHSTIRSRGYTTGRYSPRRERCVHHFHQLLAERFNGKPS